MKMMRSFLVAISVGFVLISAAFEAKAESVTLNEVGGQRLLKAKRRLNEVQRDNNKPNDQLGGRKVNVGTSAAASQSHVANNDDDDVNESYGNYGNDDNKGDTHHYYPDDRRPKNGEN